MPFRSMSQKRLFYAKMDRGEISPKKVKEWEEHTPKDKKLPEKVSKMKKSAFWSGFGKMAAEQYMTIPGGAPQESLVKMNPQGGVDPRTPEDAQAAMASGLITLPQEVEGASCGTCLYFRSLSDMMGHGFCTNPAVKQEVTEHMHCTNWENPASYHSGEQEEADAMQAQEAAQQQAAAAPMQADPQAGMPPQPQPTQAQGGAEFSQPGQEQLGTTPAASTQQGGKTFKQSPVGNESGFPEGAQTSGNPLVEQAVDDFQGAAGTASPAGGGGNTPDQGTSEPKKPKKPKDSKKSEGHTININVGKGSEKKASWTFCDHIVKDCF